MRAILYTVIVVCILGTVYYVLALLVLPLLYLYFRRGESRQREAEQHCFTDAYMEILGERDRERRQTSPYGELVAPTDAEVRARLAG